MQLQVLAELAKENNPHFKVRSCWKGRWVALIGHLAGKEAIFVIYKMLSVNQLYTPPKNKEPCKNVTHCNFLADGNDYDDNGDDDELLVWIPDTYHKCRVKQLAFYSG